MGHKVRAGAAIFCWKGDPHPAPGAELPEQLHRVAAVLVDFRGDGIDVLCGKFPYVFADELLFLGQPEIHAAPSP